ncbi:hypothetical protein [Vannielia sp.]|uniref:hypothetical protein n=1 Tax=Vannielia sp. TaxID=2813045 RepID=UPI00261B6B41|nr:hypothetical protein [Vannielia sp.]MDF1871210.1 hypothetical protein [Vannielia sp.]
MADPMSNVEIEDVLSSIRRLVSEKQSRPAEAEATTPDAANTAKATDNALVLTPALRVEETAAEAEPTGEQAMDAGAVAESNASGEASSDETALDRAWAAAAVEAEGAPGLADTAADEEDQDLQMRVEELEAAFEGGDFEPDGSEIAAGEEQFEWPSDAEGEDGVIDLSTPDVPSGQILFMRSRGASEASAAAEEMAGEVDALEHATLGGDAALPEAEGDEALSESEEAWHRASQAPNALEGEALPDPAVEPATEEVDAPQDFVFHAAARDAVEPVARLHPEPADAEDPALAAYDLGVHTGPRAAAEATPEAVGAGEVLDEDDGPAWEPALDEAEDGLDEAALAAALNDPLPGEAALIDEARLTELVSGIVREELRGALGERITQNVRKLVRREIQRALETRGIR